MCREYETQIAPSMAESKEAWPALGLEAKYSVRRGGSVDGFRVDRPEVHTACLEARTGRVIGQLLRLRQPDDDRPLRTGPAAAHRQRLMR